MSDEDMGFGDDSSAPAPAPQEQQPSQQTLMSDKDMGLMSDEEMGLEPAQSSATGAFTRGLAKSVAPTVGSLPAIGAGAEAGAAVGALAGPVGAAAGGIIGGGLGAIGAGYLISKAQDAIIDKLGLTSLDSKQSAADAEQHPYAQLAGSLTGGLTAFGAGAATGVQRLAGAAIFGGLETGQEAVQEGKVDPTKVAMAAVAGAVAPNPREYAEKLIGAGGRFAGRMGVPGRPDVKIDPAATSEKETADAANDTPIVSKGVATEQPPVNDELSLGRAPDNKPVRSERTYAKDNAAPAPGIETAPSTKGVDTSFLSADQLAALQSSLDTTSITNQREAPAVNRAEAAGEESAPVATGLDKLRPPQAEGEAQPAPQAGPQPAAPVPETAPAAQYPHPEIEGLTIDRRRKVAPTMNGVTSSKDKSTVFVDRSVPPSIDVAGKKLDPAVPMAVREIAFRNALQHAATHPDVQKVPVAALRQAAMELGHDAEKSWLESRGYDYDAYQQALRGEKPAEPVPAQEPAAADVPAAAPEQAVPPKVGPEQLQPHLDRIDATLNDPEALSRYDEAGQQHLREQAENLRQEIAKRSSPPAAEAQPAEASSGLGKLGPAPEVTATVTRPKVVDAAVAALKERGLTKHIEGLEAVEPARQPLVARKILEQLQGRGGRAAAGRAVKDNPKVEYATARIPSKPAEVEGLGVTARSKADAERKVGAIKATQSAFDKFAPTDDKVPTSKADKQALKDRLLGAIQHANMENGGKDPITTYKPVKNQPASWQWLKAAQKLAQSRMTQKQIAEFVATEKMLRSGNVDDAAMVRQGNRIESDIAMQRAPTTETADLAGAFRDKEFPGEIVPAEDVPGTERPATMEDIEPQTEKTLDLANMKPEEAQQLHDDMDRVAQNLIKMQDAPKVPAAQAEREAVAERTGKLKRAREAATMVSRTPAKPVGESEGAASPVKRIQVTPEAQKAALEAFERAQAKEKSRYGTPQPADVPTDKPRKYEDLADFYKDQDGKLDIQKVTQSANAMMGKVRAVAEKYFGVPDGDVAHKADVVLAQTMFEKARMEAQSLHLTDADWHAWAKQKMDDTLTYLKAYETHPDLDRAAFEQVLKTSGIDDKSAAFMSGSREMMRKVYDQMFQFEAEHGSRSEYRQGYIRHVFKDEEGVQKWLDERIKSLGANSFQKERTFDTIAEAMKAGFELKFENPIDILTSRWKMGVNSSLLTAALRRLRKDGLAEQIADESLSKNRKQAIRDWYQFTNNMDGTKWAIHPDAKPLWMNAMEAKGLAEQNNPVGHVYNGWMQIKRVWAPVQLMLGAFHATHIAVGNVVQNITNAVTNASKNGEWAKEFSKAGKLSLDQTLFSLPFDKIKLGGIGDKLDAMSGGRFSSNVGRDVMNYWHLPEAEMTPDQRMTTGLLREMAVVPENSRQEVIGAKRSLQMALQKDKYATATVAGIRRGIEKIQAPLFNYMIPQMKVQAALNAAAAAIQRDPELLTNHVKRQQIMREIGQNIHDRYGEMFYDAMFWNKTVKDIGIGSMLSLSWNVGQLRQVAGAARDLYTGARGRMGMPVTTGGRMAAYRRQGSDKAAFVASYVALTMGINGLMSYAMSGQLPTGLDYVFARNGLKNPDGTPSRISNPFNTREPTMLMAHAEEHGNLIGGAMAFMWNKMMLSPITEAWNNRDFFGRELYDPNAPWYKRAVQLVDSTLGNHLSPIILSGNDRVAAQGGGVGLKALAWAGFGPAPKYVSNDAWQNRINQLYFNNAGPRAYEYGDKTGLGRGLVQGAARWAAGDQLQSEQMQEGREHLNQGYARGDVDLQRQGRQEMVRAGISPRYGGRVQPGQEFQYKFQRLPLDQQRGLYRIMGEAERDTYVRKNPILNNSARYKIEQGITKPAVQKQEITKP